MDAVVLTRKRDGVSYATMPDYPSLVAKSHVSEIEAVKMLGRMLADHVERLRATGSRITIPRTARELENDPDYREQRRTGAAVEFLSIRI